MVQNEREITIDLLVIPAGRFIHFNRGIATALGVTIKKLEHDHHRLADYLNTNCNPAQVYVQSEVPEGKAPALIVVPKGIQGSFFVLPDRIHPGTYMALNYRKLLPEQEGGQQREVHWMSRLPPKQI